MDSRKDAAASVQRKQRVTWSIPAAFGWLMLCLLPAAQPVDLDEAQRDAITAIVFDSAITLRAKERQTSKELRHLYDLLASVTAGAMTTGEKHRRELTLKDRIIRKLEAADRVYAAQIQGFKGSLQELSRTPEGARILLEYQKGDKREALAALETFIAARQQLRTVGAQALYIADLRVEATLALDAADKGEVEMAYAIRKLEALSVEETDNWRTWLTLFRIYFSDGQYEQARRCLTEADRILDGKENIASIFAIYAGLDMKVHDIYAEVEARGVMLDRDEEFRRHHVEYIISIENDEAEEMLMMTALGESLQNLFSRGSQDEKPRGDLENALVARGERTGAVCDLLAETSGKRARQDSAINIEAGQERRDALFNFAFEDAARTACRKHAEHPTVAQYARQLAFVFERLGHLYLKADDRPLAILLYQEARSIDRALLAEHPASLDLRRNLATSVFNLALVDGTPERWAEACSHLEGLYRERRLLRRDLKFRETACRQATSAPE